MTPPGRRTTRIASRSTNVWPIRKRIKTEVKEGDLTKSQAASLHKDDRQIRQEERLMASQNGGHITKQEQKTLNQQENAVSRQIGK